MADKEGKVTEVLALPDKLVAKFVTAINMQRLTDDNIILGLISKGSGDAPSVLVDTILVDMEHARKIVDTLTQVINAPEKDDKNLE